MLFVRLVHTLSMALLLGGALLLTFLAWRAREHPAGTATTGELLRAARAYEVLFWLGAGLLLLTGIGNLGVFGAGLPGPRTGWGTAFLLKLAGVALLLLASVFRSLLAAGAGGAEARFADSRRAFLALYGATGLLLLLIVFLAVRLAHG